MTEAPEKKKPSSKPYTLLRTTAFDVPEEGIGGPTYVVDLPAEWIRSLKDLALRATPGRSYASIPIYSLNAALQALAPGLGIPLTRAGRDTGKDQPWLVSGQPLPVDRLIPVVASWIHTQRNEHTPDAAIEDVLNVIRSVPLQNHERALAEAIGESTIAGMRVLESQAAALLTAGEATFERGGTQLSFVRTARSDGSGGEVMSWPPLRDRKGGAYSVIVRATAQSVPGAYGLKLFTHCGVRRWMTTKPFVLPGNSTSVYFHATAPYINDGSARPHFTIARAKSVVAQGTDGVRTFEFEWDDRLIAVLDGAAGLPKTLPPLHDLMANLASFAEASDEPAVVPFRFGRTGTAPGVSAGLHVEDRDKLHEWASNVLREANAAPWAPLTLMRPNPKRQQPMKKSGKLVRGSVADSTASVIGPRLNVELVMPQQSAELALEGLAERLPGAALRLGASTTVDTAYGPLEIDVSTPDGSDRLAAPLSAQASRKGQTSAKSRVSEIAQLGQATVPTVTIVEIQTAETFSRGELARRDPKNAVRHGLARTGRVSQFVNPPIDNPTENRIRFNKAVDDALRQLGMRPDASGFRAASPAMATPGLKYLAFWILRRNRNKDFNRKHALAVAVVMNADCTNIQARTSQTTWQPLHQATATIGKRFGADAMLKETNGGVMNLIRDVLSDLARDETPVLMLSHAQNLRSEWPYLTNSNIEPDRLAFGEIKQPVTDYPGLRHVRVRTAESNETPQVFGYDPDEVDADTGRARVGRPRGLWAYRDDRIFASTAAKPGTNKVPQGISKFPAQGEALGAIQKAVFNQQLVELYVAGLQPGDNPTDWAALAHELRDANPFHPDETTLPWPLRVAEQLGEYITPVYVEPEDDSTGSTWEPGTPVWEQGALFDI